MVTKNIKKFINYIFIGISTFDILPGKKISIEDIQSKIDKLSNKELEDYNKVLNDIINGQIIGFFIIIILQSFGFFMIIKNHDIIGLFSFLSCTILILYSKYFHKNKI